MTNKFSIDLADRLKSATAARRLHLDQMRPTPARPDPLYAEREAMRQKALERVRAERSAGRTAKQQAAVDIAAQAANDRIAAEDAALALKQGQRKERKMLSATEAKAKRDKRYAARRARA